jgi:NADH-ubiquinone oxidoreductase chain 1
MKPMNRILLVYLISPLFIFTVVLVIWLTLPVESNYINLELGGLLFFCCRRFIVYGLIGRGWASNSRYAVLGAGRGIAQTISYEVSLILYFICIVVVIGGIFNIVEYINIGSGWWVKLQLIPLFVVWFSLRLAETNRTPYDFAEGESELVSGFNVEYIRGGFALLFLAEYARIIFISYLIVVLFMIWGIRLVIINVIGVILILTFIWLRGTLPRLRYDKLIEIAWKSYLPLSMYYFMYLIGVEQILII